MCNTDGVAGAIGAPVSVYVLIVHNLIENGLPTSSLPRSRMFSQKASTTAEAEAVGLEEWTKYCEDTSATKRRASRTVWAGKVPIGSEHRIARQTMTTTNTNDVDATVAQARARSVTSVVNGPS